MNILNNISPIMALSGLTIGLIVVVAVLLVAVIVVKPKRNRQSRKRP